MVQAASTEIMSGSEDTSDITGKGRLHAPSSGEWLDAHSKFSGGDGKVHRSEAELTDTSWDDVSWDDIKEASARALLEAETGMVDPDVKEKYLKEKERNNQIK